MTAVGDRFVFECMEENGYRLGGEQSGHIILRKYATTGDGILTALMVAEEMRDQKLPLSKLCEGMKLFPQRMKSLRVTDKEKTLDDPVLQERYEQINAKLGKKGRALLRASGTEPVIRVMLECEEERDCERYLEELCELIKKRGYCCE